MPDYRADISTSVLNGTTKITMVEWLFLQKIAHEHGNLYCARIFHNVSRNNMHLTINELYGEQIKTASNKIVTPITLKIHIVPSPSYGFEKCGFLI